MKSLVLPFSGGGGCNVLTLNVLRNVLPVCDAKHGITCCNSMRYVYTSAIISRFFGACVKFTQRSRLRKIYAKVGNKLARV